MKLLGIRPTRDKMLLPVACLVVGVGLLANRTRGANQTPDVSPVIVNGRLPYAIDVQLYDMGETSMPSLHSFASATFQGQWILLAGRTNGLHGFSFSQDNFPEESQNRDIWVVDPVAKQTWSRSWDAASASLSESEILSLSAANMQFEAMGNRLYLTGGYGADDPNDAESRSTFDTLTAIDLPGIVDWIKNETGQAADHIRQMSDPLFQVTGGSMHEIGGKMHLVFGQDFDGVYNPVTDGTYTNQVRTFTIQDDGTTLGFAHVQSSTPADEYRRRDLNVAPALRDNGSGGLEEGLIVYSGVFTPSFGAWTVPVEVDADGNPSMADSDDAGVFRQGMNNYHSAKVGMFSEQSGDMHEILFGGITYQQYDESTGQFISDANLPFTNQLTSVVRSSSGDYEQYLLGEFPEILDPLENRIRFGANAEFFPAAGIEHFDNGVLNLDAIDEPTVIGYIFGGIEANAPHVRSNPDGLSAASGHVFEVLLTPFLEADFDTDGNVDDRDLAIWNAAFGTDATGDADFDDDTDGADFLIWQQQFAMGVATTNAVENSNAVPEPSSIALALLGLLAGAGWGYSAAGPMLTSGLPGNDRLPQGNYT